MPSKRESKKSLKKRQRKEKKNRKNGKSKTKKSSAKKNRKQNSRNNRFIALPEYSIAFSNLAPNHSVSHNNTNTNNNPNIKRHFSSSSSSFMSVNRDGNSHYRSKHMESDGKTTKIKTDIDGEVSEKIIRHNNSLNRVSQSLFFMDTRPMILSRRLYF